MFQKNKKRSKIALIPKLLLMSFIMIASVQVISTLVVFNSPEFSQAANIELKLNVPIDGDNPISFNSNDTSPIANYIAVVYKYAIGVVGIVAAVVMMIGGLIWLTAGGNATQVSKAKSYIGASLGGLVLTLGSYMILYQINPKLVDPTIREIKSIGAGEQQKTVSTSNIKNCENELRGAGAGEAPLISAKSGGIKSSGSCSGTNSAPTVGGLGSGILESQSTCYCTYNPMSPEYKWSPDGSCPKDQEIKGKKDEATSIRLCGSEIGNGEVCCGPKKPERCNNIINCTNIRGTSVMLTEAEYTGLSCSNPQSCEVSKPLAERLQSLYSAFKKDKLVITEAWPPTREHVRPCHGDGTCVDLRTKDIDTQQTKREMAIKANELGLRVEYECISGGCCNGWAEAGLICKQLPKGTKPGTISEEHFSVYLR